MYTADYISAELGTRGVCHSVLESTGYNGPVAKPNTPLKKTAFLSSPLNYFDHANRWRILCKIIAGDLFCVQIEIAPKTDKCHFCTEIGYFRYVILYYVFEERKFKVACTGFHHFGTILLWQINGTIFSWYNNLPGHWWTSYGNFLDIICYHSESVTC